MATSQTCSTVEEEAIAVRSLATPTLCSSKLPSSIDGKLAVAAFRSQRESLLGLTRHCLPALANSLYAKCLITEDVCEKSRNELILSSVRAGDLLDCVQARIHAQSSDFIKVVQTLESVPSLVRLAKQLVEAYCEPTSADSPPVLSPAVARFADDLKAKYRSSPTSSQKWPPTPSREYIKLALVKGRKKGKDDYIGHVLEGNIEKVIERMKLSEEDILKLCAGEARGKVIVIQGAPGIGKSTLAWELCRKWEDCASMKAYCLVILLRLREKRVHNISDISSLFYAYQRSDKISLVDEVQNNQGKGVLFVLNGFDELPKSLQQEGALVDLLQKSILPKSTIVVTSRPSACDELFIVCNLPSANIEILGFAQESVEAYAASVFSSESKDLENFKSYISAAHNPAINSLMYVPLYCHHCIYLPELGI